VQQALYAEVPIRLQAEGTYHNLGQFFDRISKFPRIINVSEISIRAKNEAGSSNTIVAECTATTFVLQEGAIPKKGAKTVPKQPSVAKGGAK
jgi:type IV pilus assembly protein PilO